MFLLWKICFECTEPSPSMTSVAGVWMYRLPAEQSSLHRSHITGQILWGSLKAGLLQTWPDENVVQKGGVTLWKESSAFFLDQKQKQNLKCYDKLVNSFKLHKWHIQFCWSTQKKLFPHHLLVWVKNCSILLFFISFGENCLLAANQLVDCHGTTILAIGLYSTKVWYMWFNWPEFGVRMHKKSPNAEQTIYE